MPDKAGGGVSTEYTAADAHAAVERGAAWLDSECPDWVTEINLDDLDLGNAELCVLGQTAHRLPESKPRQEIGADDTGYWMVLHGYGLERWWAIENGFLTPELTAREYDVETEMLSIAWREYIRQRLGVAQ